MMQEASLSIEEASKRFYLVDKAGLITESIARETGLRKGLSDFVRPNSDEKSQTHCFDWDVHSR